MIHEVAAEILSRIDRDGEPIRMRLGVVQVVNADNTLDVTVGGDTTPVPDVRRLTSYTPTAQDTVLLLVAGPDLVVLGSVAV